MHSLSILRIVSSYGCFRFLNTYISERKKASLTYGSCHGWLAVRKICWRNGKRRKTRKDQKHIFQNKSGAVIKWVCLLSISLPAHEAKQVAVTIILFTRVHWRLNIYVKSTQFSVQFFVVFFFPRTLIKIHQKQCFQQQCLKMLSPPLSSIKSGSSSLKGDEKLSLTLCHTPVKRRAHSKQQRVQVLIYYFAQIIFLPFFLTMRTFTSQMELSVSAVGMCWPRVFVFPDERG